MQTKKCSCCELIKSAEDFAKNKARYDGLQNNCKDCNKKQRESNKERIKEYREEYYDKNKHIMAEKYKERIREYDKEYRKRNKDKLSELRKERYRKSRDSELQDNKEYRLANKERLADYRRLYIENNRDLINAISAKRRSVKLNATPKWLTSEDWIKIQLFYKIASILQKVHKIIYHVDHIIPLQGKNVCGLHVPWNLQVITAEENMQKGNRL